MTQTSKTQHESRIVSASPVAPCALLRARPDAIDALPADQRLGLRLRLHKAIERRRREAIALASRQLARRNVGRRVGRGEGREQQHGGRLKKCRLHRSHGYLAVLQLRVMTTVVESHRKA